MNFKAIIKSQSNFNDNPSKIYQEYAKSLSFAEWLDIYFHDRHSAIRLNELVNKKFKINNLKLDLFMQAITGNNELQILKKINNEFPSIQQIYIDLNGFNSKQDDVLTLIQHFNQLDSFIIYMNWTQDFDISLTFPNVKDFKISIIENCFNPMVKFSIDIFICNMPNLKNCYFNNIYLSDLTIEKLIDVQINKLHLVDIYYAFSIQSLFHLQSLTSIEIFVNNANDFSYNFLLDILIRSFKNENNNIKNLRFNVPSIEIYIPYKNILNLHGLRNLEFIVSINDSNVLFNLLVILSLVPKINSHCKIHYFLKKSSNKYDLNIFELTTIRSFIISYGYNLQEKYSNFTFSIQM